MSTKNQLTIELGEVKLTARQHDDLHKAVHEAIVKALEPSTTMALESSTPMALEPPVSDTRSATLKVSFLGTNPGLSKLTARHKGADQTITSSDDIMFNGVSSGDTISVRGESLGTTVVTIDRNADPMSMAFDPGQTIAGIFLIQ